MELSDFELRAEEHGFRIHRSAVGDDAVTTERLTSDNVDPEPYVGVTGWTRHDGYDHVQSVIDAHRLNRMRPAAYPQQLLMLCASLGRDVSSIRTVRNLLPHSPLLNQPPPDPRDLEVFGLVRKHLDAYHEGKK
jgi:hypothetical protein